MAEKIKALKTGTEANIKSTGEDLQKAREELNKIAAELAAIACAEAKENTTVNGLDQVIRFICETDCPDRCLDLCKEFEDCCEEPEKKEKKQLKKMVDQY